MHTLARTRIPRPFGQCPDALWRVNSRHPARIHINNKNSPSYFIAMKYSIFFAPIFLNYFIFFLFFFFLVHPYDQTGLYSFYGASGTPPSLPSTSPFEPRRHWRKRGFDGIAALSSFIVVDLSQFASHLLNRSWEQFFFFSIYHFFFSGSNSTGSDRNWIFGATVAPNNWNLVVSCTNRYWEPESSFGAFVGVSEWSLLSEGRVLRR